MDLALNKCCEVLLGDDDGKDRECDCNLSTWVFTLASCLMHSESVMGKLVIVSFDVGFLSA